VGCRARPGSAVCWCRHDGPHRDCHDEAEEHESLAEAEEAVEQNSMQMMLPKSAAIVVVAAVVAVWTVIGAARALT
jgi:hypothetical protein